MSDYEKGRLDERRETQAYITGDKVAGCKRYENESPHHAIAMREQARRFEALAEELGQGLHISMEA